MNQIKTSLIIFTLIITLSRVFAIEQLAYHQILFEGNHTIRSDVNDIPTWTRITNSTITSSYNKENLTDDAPQKWRLKIFYSTSQAQGSFSIQARLNIDNIEKPVFSFGWDNAYTKLGSREATSQWLDVPEGKSFSSLDLDVYISRSSNNPHTTIEIHNVQLEIWQDNKINVKTQQAFNAYVRPNSTRNQSIFSKEIAKNNVLSFFQATVDGDRKKVESFISNHPVSMTHMVSINKNKIDIEFPKNKTVEDYLANYEIEIISYEEVQGLFDDWEKYTVGNWQISDKSYIFIGSNVKEGGEDFMNGQPLILIMEEESGKLVIKGVLD